MMAKMNFKIIAYLDDFSACYPDSHRANLSFEAFKDLTNNLGLKLADHKCSPPSRTMEWLGYAVDSQLMRVAIQDQKLKEILQECQEWSIKVKANKRMVQSIAGRLIYVANCIPSARKFTSRILAALRTMTDDSWITITDQFRADLKWFLEYAKLSNGIFLLNPTKPVIQIECDSSLFGGGGISQHWCYTWTYTHDHTCRFPNIHHLEAVNIIVAYQTLATRHHTHPARVIIWTDNMASSHALSSGRTRDEVLGSCSRQLWLLAAANCHEVEIKHKSGRDIPLADALSRMARDEAKANMVHAAVARFHLTLIPPVLNDYVFFNSSL